MRTSAKVFRLCAVVPTGIAGSFVTIMGLGFLPGAGLVLAFFATVLATSVLARGWAEAPVARILGFARGLRPEERAALEPTLRLTERVGLSPVRVLVRLSDGDGPPAAPIGRDTVIVDPWLVQALHQQHLGVAEAATVIAHAVARQRVGAARFDLAARLWAFPWTLLLALIRGIVAAFAWVPAGGLAWHLRIVVGVVALVQGFQPGGEPPIGIGAAVLVAVSYLAPAADRAWRAMVERDADRIVGRTSLAEPLIGLVVQGRSGTAPPQRVHRIRHAACEASEVPERADRADPDAAAVPGSSCRALVHPMAPSLCRTATPAAPVLRREAPFRPVDRIAGYPGAGSPLPEDRVDPVAVKRGIRRQRETCGAAAGLAQGPARQSMRRYPVAVSDPCARRLPFPGMTTTHRTVVPARVHRAGVHADDQQTFALYGRRITSLGSREAQRLLAAAHADRVRPLCLCRPDGVVMYVARIGTDRYVIKRMPDSGLVHALQCVSYLPPEELSGLGEVLGTAITDKTESGLTALRLGFPMSRADRAAPGGPGRGGVADSASADPNRLTLRAVLQYLWQEADLATWSPGMSGKRNWGVVSWHLRRAARGKCTRGRPLATRLYVPEPFTVERKAEITARRRCAWTPLQQQGSAQPFMILIGELKAIAPARFGHQLVIKHLPDAPLMVDEILLARLNKRFAAELELWRADDAGHLMVIATFSVGRAGVATAEAISLVVTDRRWLPYESLADKHLLDAAVGNHRRFTKSLRYNLTPDKPMASLVFTDTETPTAAFLLASEEDQPAVAEIATRTGTEVWTWVIGNDMPALPPRAQSPRMVSDPIRLSSQGGAARARRDSS